MKYTTTSSLCSLLSIIILALDTAAASASNNSNRDKRRTTDFHGGTSAGITSADPVVDLDGNELLSGSKYYIIPRFRGHGGGLNLSSLIPSSDPSCPPYAVVQDTQAGTFGLPVRFSPVNPKDKVIRLSTDLNMVFAESSRVCEETVWSVEGVEDGAGSGRVKYYIGAEIGEIIGQPGPKTVTKWFKIRREDGGGDYYKMEFCPEVCSTCLVACGALGLVEEDATRKLIVLDAGKPPLAVVFVKAE